MTDDSSEDGQPTVNDGRYLYEWFQTPLRRDRVSLSLLMGFAEDFDYGELGQTATDSLDAWAADLREHFGRSAEAGGRS